MPIDIFMPMLSPTMESGDLVEWSVKEGDKIKVGDILAKIETDKAIMELESLDNGTMGKILVPAPAKGVKINSLLAIALKPNETSADLEKYLSTKPAIPSHSPSAPSPAASTVTHAEPPATPITTPPAPAASVSSAPFTGNGLPPMGTNRQIVFNSKNISSPRDSDVVASPLAKRLASTRGIDISKVFGSGPNGRVIKRDIDLFASTDGSCEMQKYSPGRISTNITPTSIPLTSMRRTVARRLVESKSSIPHFYLSTTVDMTKAMEMRIDANTFLEEKYCDHSKITINDLVIKAVAITLASQPEMNRIIGNDEIIQYNTIDISIAISVDAGIIVSTLYDANLKPLPLIAKEMKDFITRARKGQITAKEMQGGAMTISNLGSFGIDEFYAIINPPQSSILAIGTIHKTPICDANGSVKVGNMMSISVSADHRVLDGADVAMFLEAFKENLQNPIRLFLD